MQTTSELLMIRPVSFGFNSETAGNNAFQSGRDANAQDLALKEFDDLVKILRHHGIGVTVVDDTPLPHTPDSIFPNNWISFHDDGRVVLYPMYAHNRRQERKSHIIETLAKRFSIREQLDLSKNEDADLFLEGTGSMVLDRDNKIAYACVSIRTSKKMLDQFCADMGYSSILFDATDHHGVPIYHTNVMMCVADQYAIVCLEAVKDATSRQALLDSFAQTSKEVIPISLDQMSSFAGNMLQVENHGRQRYVIMSSQAYYSLTPNQIEAIKSYDPILHSSLETIERNGGGSARCMIAEIFLPLKNSDDDKKS